MNITLKTFSSRASLICTIIIFLTSAKYAFGCYKSIISFGDSTVDTGNLLQLSTSNVTPHFALPPYGNTFFHYPTGRLCNGRLILDFIAQSLGLPLVQPYFGANATKAKEFGKGVNYAVSGATALDYSFLLERGITNPTTNVSLRTQLGWFKDTLANSCQNASNCKEFLESSLVVLGMIGGNDLNYAFNQGSTEEEVQSFIPLIVKSIGSTIYDLIREGVVNILVPGNFPLGCLTTYLSNYGSSSKSDYDSSTGCLIWYNKFSESYNEELKIELIRIRELHPHATIIYGDYYNAAMQFYRFPTKYGFKSTLTACCGGGGLYNYNSEVKCGSKGTTSCGDPSLYVNWDGIHLTEAAYRWIAKGVLEGPYTSPQFNKISPSLRVN